MNKKFDFRECATLREAILLLEKKSGKCLCELAAIAGVPAWVMSLAKMGARISGKYKVILIAVFGIPEDLFPRKGGWKLIPRDDGKWIEQRRKDVHKLHDAETGRV